MIESYTYWFATALLVLLYLASAILYIVKREWVRQALADLGYPRYLVLLLTAVKLLAVVAIVSRFNIALSDLAYAGMFFHLLLSGLAHVGVGKPSGAVPAVVGLLLLGASFATQNDGREVPSPYLSMASASSISLN